MSALPFEEHESVAHARAVAHRLAASSLPIYITGEPGTGRRTLAREIADARAEGGAVIEVRGGEPAPAVANGGTALVHHPELLDSTSQVRVAGWCAAGTRVVAWGTPDFLDAAHPELRAHVGNGVVTLPALRDRGRDAIEWARLFVARHTRDPVVLAPSAARAIAAHSWPGNLTQLDGAVARALALRDAAGGLDLASPDDDHIVPLSEAVDRFRREYILQTIERFDGNRTHAARALQIDARTVFRYLEDAKSSDR